MIDYSLRLPEELLQAILDELDHPNLIRTAVLSRHWRSAARSHPAYYHRISIDAGIASKRLDERAPLFRQALEYYRQYQTPLSLEIYGSLKGPHYVERRAEWVSLLHEVATSMHLIKRLVVIAREKSFASCLLSVLCGVTASNLVYFNICIDRPLGLTFIPPGIFSGSQNRVQEAVFSRINVRNVGGMAYSALRNLTTLTLLHLPLAHLNFATLFPRLRALSQLVSTTDDLGDDTSFPNDKLRALLTTALPQGISGLTSLQLPFAVESGFILDPFLAGLLPSYALALEISSDTGWPRIRLEAVGVPHLERIFTCLLHTEPEAAALDPFQALAPRIMHLEVQNCFFPMAIHTMQGMRTLKQLVVRVQLRYGAQSQLWEVDQDILGRARLPALREVRLVRMAWSQDEESRIVLCSVADISQLVDHLCLLEMPANQRPNLILENVEVLRDEAASLDPLLAFQTIIECRT
ncbi:hypothetical protein BKA62DRAFT_729978 [Auriculariales sp. MPI-PUGE-AT-0066]|nr:hypothetical protein BKA62DRAFT_729978 [Auriculariales sp. MPI-PUGE-AT-0066]